MKEQFYEKLAAKQDWDAVANRFETDRRLTLIFDRLLAKTDLQGVRALDAGSGGGHFSAAAVKRGARVTSLDVGPNLLNQVSQRCKSDRVVGSVLEIPFPDDTFDLVFSTEVIEHTPDPLKAVRELCRVVAPGGTLIITTPCKLWQPVVRLATTLKFRPYNGYENFLWPNQLRREVSGRGCSILWLKGFNFMPLFWRPLSSFFDLFDALIGGLTPFLMVNIGVMARKPVTPAKSA